MENELALAIAVEGRRLWRLGEESAARAQFEQAQAIHERLGTLVEPERLRDELAAVTV
jgi:hypothetical protein